MAANTPIRVSPTTSIGTESLSPVRIDAAPMPRKNTCSMCRRSHLSPSQPAGSEQAPKAMKPPRDRPINSA
ncbi:hypothetical protein D3C81_2198740 [compost metagenome]